MHGNPSHQVDLRSGDRERNDFPVTFTADQVQYDRDGNLVTATGHVEAWQNDHVVRADKITYDSLKELFYAYGEVDQVYIVQQKGLGQPASTASRLR